MIDHWTPSDREGAISVVKEVFDEYHFTWDEESYHADLYDIPNVYFASGDLFYVARENGQVVGTVALEFFPRLPGKTGSTTIIDGQTRVSTADCSLERLYVRPTARRSGTGQALMKRAIQEAQNRGCSAMEIWSDKRFTQAHRLYEKLGAKTVGQRICNDPDHSPEWGLLLDLTS